MRSSVRLGQVYRCAVCGAEVLVIRARSQALAPYCCNLPMGETDRCLEIRRCDVCGAEVAVLRRDGADMDLVCCHQPMRPRPCNIPQAA